MNKIKFTRTNTPEVITFCNDSGYNYHFGYDNNKDKMVLYLERLGRLCATIKEGQTMIHKNNNVVVDENACDG